MAGDLHAYTTFSGLSLPSNASASFGTYGVVALNGGVLSLNSWTLGSSVLTASAPTVLPVNGFAVIQQASGVSLVLRSGATYYAFGSTTSAAV